MEDNYLANGLTMRSADGLTTPKRRNEFRHPVLVKTVVLRLEDYFLGALMSRDAAVRARRCRLCGS
jgi:hypothetical protein